MTVVLKCTLAILSVFVLLLGVLGYAQTRGEAREFQRAATEDVLITARSLRPMIEEIIQVEGTARAKEALERSDGSLPLVALRWIRIDEEREEPPRLRPEEVARLDAGEEVTVLERGSDQVNRVYAYVPLVHARGDALEVSRTLSEESAAVRAAAANQEWGGLALALGGTLVASVVGLWFVGRPMRALVEQARRIGGGDFAYRSPIRTRDEIGALARELDAMSGRLSEARRLAAANNEERVRVLEQLRHADRLTTVGTLAAGVAHELGTPLNVAGGHAKMIASGKLPPEQATNAARIIAAQVDRMVRILRQLLDFARRGESTKTPVQLRSIAERATGLLEALARSRQVRLELSCEEGDTSVVADAPQLEQVLTNLIVNGIQAMEGGVLRVSVTEEDETPPRDHGGPRAAFWRIDVRDQGPGIAPELLPRVFEPFFTTKPVGEGTGLGLSVAYGIVRDHGGWMSVTSERGRGTTFSVHLPATGRAPA